MSSNRANRTYIITRHPQPGKVEKIERVTGFDSAFDRMVDLVRADAPGICYSLFCHGYPKARAMKVLPEIVVATKGEGGLIRCV